MSYNKNINSTNLQLLSNQILMRKYNTTKSNYQQMRIHLLIHSQHSHYNSLYKDYLIWDNPNTCLARYYKLNKSLIKIPIKAIYYKNYLRFFSRPFIWDLRLDKVIEIFINKKAKLFYKQVYGTIQNSQKGNDNANAPSVSLYNNNEEVDVNQSRTVFDTSTRNIIDNHILTTTNNNDLFNAQDDYVLKDNQEFFTIETYNDFFVDMVNNNNRNDKGNKLKSQLFLMTPVNASASVRDEDKKKQHNSNNCSKIPFKNKNGYVKSSYCNLYKSKPNLSSNKNTNVNENNKAVNYLSNNRNEGRALQLHSPNFQINTNYSEFKKFNTQSKSISNKSLSKSKQQSLASKSNVNEGKKNQYTSYIKTTSYYKNSHDNSNKNLFKSPTNSIKGHISIEEHYTKSIMMKKGKVNQNCQHPNTNANAHAHAKTYTINDITNTQHNTHIIPKAKQIANSNNNILLNYLNNCCNSRQIKQKADASSYFSMRNLSHEKSLPIQSAKVSSHKTSYQSNRHQITHSNANSNKNIFNTAHNIQIQTNTFNAYNNNNKSVKVGVYSIKSVKNLSTHDNNNNVNKSINIKYKKISHTNNNSKDNKVTHKSSTNSKCRYNNTHTNTNTCTTTNINKSNARTPTTSSLICRNQSLLNLNANSNSNLNVNNDKGRNNSLVVIEKLIKGIKNNLYSNAIINDMSITGKNKSIKSTKPNDSTQTSSITHHHAHSKSPQLIEFAKNDSNTHISTHTNANVNSNSNTNSSSNLNLIKKYKYKSEKDNNNKGGVHQESKAKLYSSKRKGL